MDESTIASFRVTVTSVRESTWQGFVELDGECRSFASELQLLRHMMELVPQLYPGAK